MNVRTQNARAQTQVVFRSVRGGGIMTVEYLVSAKAAYSPALELSTSFHDDGGAHDLTSVCADESLDSDFGLACTAAALDGSITKRISIRSYPPYEQRNANCASNCWSGPVSQRLQAHCHDQQCERLLLCPSHLSGLGHW